MRHFAAAIALFLCAAAHSARADIRIDEHISVQRAVDSTRILIPDPLLVVYSAPSLSLIPLAAPADGRLVSHFGPRRDPFNGRIARHSGIDIANHHGTPVRAAASGRVGLAGFYGSCGMTAVIDHGAGLTTRYCHLASLSVREGDLVGVREKIGRIGATGRSTGPHLHFEVRQYGIAIDPAEHLYY